MGILLAAWLDVGSKPLRTFISIAGMVAAIMSGVVVDAAAILSRTANSQYLAQTYGRPATLQVSSADGAEALSFNDQAQVDQQLIETLTRNGVSRVSPRVDIGMSLIHGETAVQIYPVWVNSNYSQIGYINRIAGQFPSITATSEVQHLVIDLDTARRLGFSGADAVGQSLSWTPSEGSVPDLRTTVVHSMVIDAVANQIGTTSDPIPALIVFNLDQSAILGRSQRSWLIHVDSTDIDFATSLVQSVRVPYVAQSAFQVLRIDQGQNLTPVLSQQRVTEAAVTLVALIVGGLGILGVRLSTVRERGKEFGLRRALGASKDRIFAGVVVQGVIEAALEALIAIPAAGLVVDLFARQLVLASLPLPVSTALPLASAARGLITALIIGLVASLLPAARASRASVVQALRD